MGENVGESLFPDYETQRKEHAARQNTMGKQKKNTYLEGIYMHLLTCTKRKHIP